MTLEECLEAFAAAEVTPVEALRAAVPHAGELAPRVAQLMERRNAAGLLAPAEENIAFYGLYACAAAGRRELWRPFLALLQGTEDEIEGVFGDGVDWAIPQLALSLIDERTGGLDDAFALLENPDAASHARAGLLRTLARLVAEGRAPRARAFALLDRFPDLVTDPDDFALLGWFDAVALLGRDSLRERGIAVMGASKHTRDVDRKDWLERLEAGATWEGDPLSRFDEDGIAAISDPAAALDWLLRIEAMREDVAALPGLSHRDAVWLGDFCALRLSGSDPAWTPEMIDGALTAWALSRAAPLAALLDAMVGPALDRAAPEDAYALTLLERRAEAIAAAIEEGAAARPLLEERHPLDLARDWAFGFFEGTEFAGGAWGACVDDADAEPALALLRALDEAPEEDLGAAARQELAQMLPQAIAILARFFRDPASRRRRAPVRVAKVGRNEPCPCGSGKKHKKCCGAAA